MKEKIIDFWNCLDKAPKGILFNPYCFDKAKEIGITEKDMNIVISDWVHNNKPSERLLNKY